MANRGTNRINYMILHFKIPIYLLYKFYDKKINIVNSKTE